MTQEIEITSDVPLPPLPNGDDSNIAKHMAIFSKMKIGDSVLLVGNSSQSQNPMSMRQAADKMGGGITARIEPGHKGRVRIWRIA